jgi:hypothetical protein
MNKILLFIFGFIGFALISLFCIRLLSGEDDWICQNSVWIRHGNPRAPMPSAGCGIGSTSVPITPQTAPESAKDSDICTDPETKTQLTLAAAKLIAQNSECLKTGTLTGFSICNEITGTWWLDLKVEDKPGCSPACVVNVATNVAEINWRCTGLMPTK